MIAAIVYTALGFYISGVLLLGIAIGAVWVIVLMHYEGGDDEDMEFIEHMLVRVPIWPLYAFWVWPLRIWGRWLAYRRRAA